MGRTDTNGKLNPEVPAKPTRRKHSAEYKRRIIEAAEQVEAAGGSVGELLRREGLYRSQLSAWRRALAEGGRTALAGGKRGRPSTSTSSSTKLENKKLLRRVATLERKLWQAEAIIGIQKKVAALMAMPELPDDDESAS